MLAKLIVYGSTRAEAIERMRRALELFAIRGVGTTIPFLHFMMGRAEFVGGKVNTHLIDAVMPDFLSGSAVRLGAAALSRP
jgi:acetyl/propionyl-CoA carboxylase alpha subunit